MVAFCGVIRLVQEEVIPSGKAEPPLSRFSETHRSLSPAGRQGSEAPDASSVYVLELLLQIC